jgi:hypothetical protein
MYIINTNIEEVLKEFQFVESWMDTICQNILHKDREDCKVTLFYNYGYFVPKGKGSNPEQYDMMFDDRLKYELSKVRVNVTIKIDEFMMTNRLKRGMMPELVKSMVTEITKYKMSIECEFHQNQEVKDSIPDFDESVVSIEVIRKEIGTDKIEEEYFDIDDILDKIAISGIDSLTKGEKDFLDKKSKEM